MVVSPFSINDKTDLLNCFVIILSAQRQDEDYYTNFQTNFREICPGNTDVKS